MNPERRLIFENATMAERVKQDAIWGGTDHDSDHSFSDWAVFMAERVKKLQELSYSGNFSTQEVNATGRRLLIEIAALASAAFEADLGA